MESFSPRLASNGSERSGEPSATARLIELLARGESFRRAASQTGMGPGEALGRLAEEATPGEREALFSAIDTRVRIRAYALAQQAADIIENALDRGDPSVAIDLLTGLGMLPGNPAARQGEAPAIGIHEEHRKAAP